MLRRALWLDASWGEAGSFVEEKPCWLQTDKTLLQTLNLIWFVLVNHGTQATACPRSASSTHPQASSVWLPPSYWLACSARVNSEARAYFSSSFSSIPSAAASVQLSMPPPPPANSAPLHAAPHVLWLAKILAACSALWAAAAAPRTATGALLWGDRRSALRTQ